MHGITTISRVRLRVLAEGLLLGLGIVIGKTIGWVVVAVCGALLLGELVRWLYRRLRAKFAKRKLGLTLKPNVHVDVSQQNIPPSTIRMVRTYTAQVLVHNSAERGGDQSTVRNALPEFEIHSPQGDSIFRYKGWDQSEPRDFTPRQEEHALEIARRLDDQPFAIPLPRPMEGIAISGEKPFKVRVIVRADNIPPVTEWFDLTNPLDGEMSFAKGDQP
jgi:hypothetical protein